LVGVSSWEQAQDEHPDFSSDEKLQVKFLELPFSKDMPAMIAHCQKAHRWAASGLNFYNSVLVQCHNLVVISSVHAVCCIRLSCG